VVDRRTGSVERIQLFAPHEICARQDPIAQKCVAATDAGIPTHYEGRAVTSDPAVVEAMVPALKRVHDLQATGLGVSLDASIRRAGELGSPLGNLFADALREAVPDADVAVVNNATGGLRADLPAGPITFGRLYDVFPFDNRVVRITLAGAELVRWLTDEIRQGRRGALGVSGVGVRAACSAERIHVELFRPSGLPIHDEDQLAVVTIGSPTLSGAVLSAARPGSFSATDNAPIVREVVEDWLRQPGRRLLGDVADAANRRGEVVDIQLAACVA
jgi:5'-nucleotidase